jgi:hypothetical protein
MQETNDMSRGANTHLRTKAEGHGVRYLSSPFEATISGMRSTAWFGVAAMILVTVACGGQQKPSAAPQSEPTPAPAPSKAEPQATATNDAPPGHDENPGVGNQRKAEGEQPGRAPHADPPSADHPAPAEPVAHADKAAPAATAAPAAKKKSNGKHKGGHHGKKHAGKPDADEKK